MVVKSDFRLVLFVKINLGSKASSAIILIVVSVVGGEIKSALEVKAKSANLSIGRAFRSFSIPCLAII